MHESSSHVEKLSGAGSVRPFRRAFRLPGCFLSVLLSVVTVGLFGKTSSGENIIWLANGLILAYLLIVPKWRWRFYLVASAAGLIVGSALIHESWRMNLLYNALDVVEAGTAAILLRRRSTVLPRFTDAKYLARFIAFAVIGGPFAAGSLMAIFSYIGWRSAPIPALGAWLGTDCIGIAVTTPVFIAIFQNSLKTHVSRSWQLACCVLLIVVTIGVFGQSHLPLLFMILPILLLIQLRMGLGWAAIGAIFVTLAGGSLTVRGYGPLSSAFGVSSEIRPFLLQLFIISAMFMMYCVSVVLENEKSIERRLTEIVSIHRLIVENSRDVIILSDFDGRPYYVSPAIHSLLGCGPETLMEMEGMAFVYPGDEVKFATVLRGIRSGSDGAIVQHRIQKADGEFVWVETSLRAIRDPGTRVSTGALGIIRDISERKHAEKELEAAYQAVEALAAKDALTGLANRRRLDEALTSEWRRGLRDRSPLSFLLLDVDHFKAYNDTYGHVQGDSCLKRIAELARGAASRTGDLVARYGGEEFAIILPNTPATGAFEMAHLICTTLRRQLIPHGESAEGIVTISIGCATLIPSFDQSEKCLIELADKALYLAKTGGRNRVCVADSAEKPAD